MLLRDAMLAYVHYLFVLATVGAVAMEAALCRPGIDAAGVRRIGLVDLAYLFVALGALGSGLLRVWLGLKGASYYFSGWLIYLKLGLFGLVGLLSILPTVRFLRWARRLKTTAALPASEEVRATAWVLYAELLLLAALPMLGALMARGFFA